VGESCTDPSDCVDDLECTDGRDGHCVPEFFYSRRGRRSG